MRNAIIKISSLCIIFVACLVCFVDKEASAFPVTDLTFVDGLNERWGWRFYVGTSANEGGAAGEWQATADGSTTMGYFLNPWAQNMVTGTYSGLSSTLDTYRAAWLIDQFSVGLGRNWQPAGYSGYSTTDGRTALAFAIYEVCMSADTDLSLSDGNFYILPVTAGDPAPTRALTLGQAYLNALSTASLNLAYLDNNYDVIAADQTNPNWTGYGFANLVVPTQNPSAVPEPATLLLFSIGGITTALLRRKKKLS
jgi:hypothetical protein